MLNVICKWLPTLVMIVFLSGGYLYVEKRILTKIISYEQTISEYMTQQKLIIKSECLKKKGVYTVYAHGDDVGVSCSYRQDMEM